MVTTAADSAPVDAAAATAVAAAAGAAPTAPVVPKLFQGRLRVFYPLYRAFELWSDADGLRMSAAMSFYGILSLAPLLVLIVAVLGWWLDRQMLETSLITQIGGVVGQQGAEVIKAAIASAQEPGKGLFASLLAFVLLLVGATGVFAELQSALERLWTQGTGVDAVDAWWHTATLRLRGVAYILAFGFLMLVSTVIASLLSLLEQWAGSRFEMKLVLATLNQAISFLITTGLFVALMRMSAGPQPSLRYLLRGAAVGALLFGVGKYALALYLSTAAVVSAYGAAGSLVVLLMWIYFAAAVLLFAASVARVMAERHGQFSPAPTPPPAAAVTGLKAEARAQGDDMTAQASTAAVAAALADGEGPAQRPAGRQAVAAPRSHEALALLISVAAAWLMTRPKAGSTEAPPAWAAREAARPPRPRDERRAPSRGDEPARERGDAQASPAWLGAAVVAARALRAGVRLAQGAAQPSKRDDDGLRLHAPRALRQWGGRAVDSHASSLGTHWRQWRERQSLSHAERTVARDVQALRDALRKR